MRVRIQATKLFLSAVCASGLLNATARGAELKPASHERGKIESVNPAGNTLTVQKAHSKDTQVFLWNENTTFQQRESVAGKPQNVTAADLKPGEHVNVEYYKEGDHLVARKITISHENHAAGTATQPSHS